MSLDGRQKTESVDLKLSSALPYFARIQLSSTLSTSAFRRKHFPLPFKQWIDCAVYARACGCPPVPHFLEGLKLVSQTMRTRASSSGAASCTPSPISTGRFGAVDDDDKAFCTHATVNVLEQLCALFPVHMSFSPCPSSSDML